MEEYFDLYFVLKISLIYEAEGNVDLYLIFCLKNSEELVL